MNGVRKDISGWGKYPVEECILYRPESEMENRGVLSSGSSLNFIPFGLGRSYGDACLNKSGGLILQRKLNRFIGFEPHDGILECEAGVSLEEIIEYFLPKGFFLPVTPGTKYVTVGGAISNDVHGKNHHIEGCFSEFVIDFKLMIASGEVILCSRNHNSQIFWATIGGIGLTGIILSARIKLQRVETAYIKVDYHKASNLDEALQLFESSDSAYKYSVAWIDCLATGRSLGRSILMRGDHAAKKDLNAKLQDLSLIISPKRNMNIPINFPSFTLNSFSVNLFNSFYYAVHNNETKIVDYDSFFYPLDSINNWNRMYGRRGFVQYQAVIPTEHSREGLVALLERLGRSRRSSFLAVLKSSGNQNNGMLSFPFKGYTLALDIPIKDDSLFSFLRELDEIVLRYGGRIYLAKDAELSQDSFVKMYPRIEEFKAIKEKIDPKNLFSSSMARRLGIVGRTK